MTQKIYTRYDAIGRPIAKRVFRFGQLDSFVGDPVFAPAPVSDPSNPSELFPAVLGTTKQDFEYDGLSRKTVAVDDLGPAAGDSLIEWSYDSLSRIVEERQEFFAGGEQVISYGWRAGNLRTNVIYPNGRTVEYAFDSLDRIDTISDQGATDALVDYDYIGRNRVLERIYPLNGTRLSYLDDTGTQVIGYDNDRRVTEMRHLRNNNSLVVGFEYAYNRQNSVLAQRKLHALSESELVTLDSAYRTLSFERGELNAELDDIVSSSSLPPIHQDWTLDGAGNWEQVDGEAREHSSNNEIVTRIEGGTTQISYDDKGNLVDDGTFPLSVRCPEPVASGKPEGRWLAGRPVLLRCRKPSDPPSRRQLRSLEWDDKLLLRRKASAGRTGREWCRCSAICIRQLHR